ncbi:MAG: hypothetical protein HY822_18980 [Acidobacteria bacterium]|nr:hypothetical protein [Acidobacteriota bacterium]
MTRHLNTCISAGRQPPAVSSPGKRLPIPVFHLFVEARYDKAYWMHLAVPMEAHLGIVDAFLRQIWLECCGHLSAFTIQGRRYASAPMADFQESGMGVRLSRLLQPGMVFSYEYDYGSTTALSLKVLAVRARATDRGAVELLARNDAPMAACDQCGSQPATMVCTECASEDQGGWLCEPCADGHDCGTEMCLPVVNSPRVGVCGYTG